METKYEILKTYEHPNGMFIPKGTVKNADLWLKVFGAWADCEKNTEWFMKVEEPATFVVAKQILWTHYAKQTGTENNNWVKESFKNDLDAGIYNYVLDAMEEYKKQPQEKWCEKAENEFNLGLRASMKPTTFLKIEE